VRQATADLREWLAERGTKAGIGGHESRRKNSTPHSAAHEKGKGVINLENQR